MTLTCGGRFKFEDYESVVTAKASRRVDFGTIADIYPATARASPLDARVVQGTEGSPLRVGQT